LVFLQGISGDNLVMDSFNSTKQYQVVVQLDKLRSEQSLCSNFLSDCMYLYGERPEYSEQLEAVICSVERALEQNAERINRLQTQPSR
jgi:hypothetical protein